MTKFKNITKNGFICRNCINRLYGARLERTDCIYDEPYPRKCARCGEMRNIVTGLTLGGKIKLIGKSVIKE
ncbi:MAG: hypothetical protein IKS17_05705 [Firmicutes bacterium]|nr:hypothetical protein [Bacillota bacterium]